MYTLIYNVRETEGNKVSEREYRGEEWRLRRTALNYLREIVRESYIENGYGTENIVGGIQCYKSEKTNKDERKITEIRIKVEKVK